MMKKIGLLIFPLLFAFQISAQESVNWMSMGEALEAQKKEPRKIIMDAYTHWCYPCKLMDKNTFGNPDVANFINKNFYAVKFDAEGNEEVDYKGDVFSNPKYDPQRAKRRNYQHDFAKALKINAYPTIVFFDEKGDVIAPVPGYLKPSQIEIYFQMMISDEYKKLTTSEAWEQYQKDFKPTFKD